MFARLTSSQLALTLLIPFMLTLFLPLAWETPVYFGTCIYLHLCSLFFDNSSYPFLLNADILQGWAVDPLTLTNLFCQLWPQALTTATLPLGKCRSMAIISLLDFRTQLLMSIMSKTDLCVFLFNCSFFYISFKNGTAIHTVRKDNNVAAITCSSLTFISSLICDYVVSHLFPLFPLKLHSFSTDSLSSWTSDCRLLTSPQPVVSQDLDLFYFLASSWVICS